jgi:hypothetical protein
MASDLNLFGKYPNKVFVETGTCVGVGVTRAISAGFEDIYSIELSEELYIVCKGYFKDCPNVHLIHGDSRFVLKEVIDKINVPITFWLDAHRSGGLTVGELVPPLLEEIAIIKTHPLRTHTVMIDDLRCWGWTDRLKRELSLINQDYRFILEDGTFEKDVLVAIV